MSNSRIDATFKGVDLFKDFVTGRINYAFASYVDQCYRNMHAANAAEPYDHAEYERFENMFKASLLLLVNGDQFFAQAFYHAFLSQGGESVMGVTRRLRLGEETRNDFCYNAGVMSYDEWYNNLPVVVEWLEIDPFGNERAYTDRYQTVALARAEIGIYPQGKGKIVQGE